MNQSIFFAAVVLAFCVFPIAAHDVVKSGCLFVSHLVGEDSSQCGSSITPCQTLPQALLLVREGGKICLDGKNSQSNPYRCKTIGSGGLTTLFNKSVTIQGHSSRAHIFCSHSEGLAFKLATKGSLRVTLSNLVFRGKGVTFRNGSHFNVIITKCKFIDCRTAVAMHQDKSGAFQKSSLEVIDTEFRNNSKSLFVFLRTPSFVLHVSGCLFRGKGGRNKIHLPTRPKPGTLQITSNAFTKIQFFVSINNSIFRDNGYEEGGSALSISVPVIYNKAYLSLYNTSFFNNQHGVYVYGGLKVNLTDVKFHSTYGYALVAQGLAKFSPEIVGVEVFLERCVLANNRAGILIGETTCLDNFRICSTYDQTLIVKNSLFLGGLKMQDSSEAIKMTPRNVLETTETPPNVVFKAVLLLQNVTFKGLENIALSISAGKRSQGLISIKNCKFLFNTNYLYRINQRSTIEIEFPGELPPSCRDERWIGSSEINANLNQSRLPVIFEDTIFTGNVAISGAINILNGNISFINCLFKNNLGLTLGGHIYLKPGYGSLAIEGTTFLQTSLEQRSITKEPVLTYARFLYSESNGALFIRNSTFTARVSREFYPIITVVKSNLIKMDTYSTVMCPFGQQIKLDRVQQMKGFKIEGGNSTCWMNATFLKFTCAECSDGLYSLQRGSANGLSVNNETICLPCPYGASCMNSRITAKQNFWGFNISSNPSSLQFLSCPLEYCGPPNQTNYYNYNGCHGSRSGVLCGQCSDGYSEVLYSTSCRKEEKCNDHWFWLASFIYVVVFALYVVFKPPIFSLLYRQSLWFRKKSEASPNEDSCDEHDAGYLKIIFYFYQVAELVMIKSPENALHMVPFITPVMALFNFKVKTMNGSIGCPFPGLNVVTKELFMCLKFLATLASIASIYAIHRGISKTWYISTLSLTLYLAVALETLLLGYETLADTTLKLMHCVPIGLEWRLFVDGNIQCWQWWQYMLIVFIVVFVIPLVLVLFWGSLMLSKDKVSAKEFLTSCAFPLPFLFIWLFRYCKKRPNANQFEVPRRSSNNTEEIKKVLHDPFRPASDDDHGTLYWESVLTGRRLILLTIHTFATDPMIRFVCLDCACLVILLHHLASRPFRDRKANIFESLSLVSLVVICTFNLAEITYISEGIEPTGPNENLFHALLWIEIVLLGLLPAVACMLVVFATLSQVVRVLYHCIRVLSDVMHKCATRGLCLGSSSRSRQVLFYWDPEEELYSVT